MKTKKNRLKIFLKFGVFLFGVPLLLWNCEKEEYSTNFNEVLFKNIETVSFNDAILFFKSKKNHKDSSFERNDQNFTTTPDWNTLKYNEIAYTDAQLTTANTQVNRNGNYSSELYFINVNGIIKNVIFTIYKDSIDENGNVIDGRIFFNDVNGKFIDGYIIEDGIFTKRYIVQVQTQKASFFPLILFQSLTTEGDCWNTDTLGDFEGGTLDEVVITASGGGTDSGNSDNNSSGAGYSDSYNWYYTSGPGSVGYGNYINYAALGSTSGGGSNLTNSQITSAAAAILLLIPLEPDEKGECPPGYILNTQTGKCDPICPGLKIPDPNDSSKCICPTGKVEDSNGNCVDKPCKKDPVLNPEIAPQKGVSGTQGAMYGCKRYGRNDCTTPRNKRHKGIDLKSNFGDPIYAMYDGFIFSTKYQKKGAGYYTRIQSTVNGETFLVEYFHMQQQNRILQGTPLVQVKAGDIIGYQGDSGNLKDAIAGKTVDSHIHIEIRVHDGGSSWSYSHFNPVDPRLYFSTTINSNGLSQTNTNCN